MAAGRRKSMNGSTKILAADDSQMRCPPREKGNKKEAKAVYKSH